MSNEDQVQDKSCNKRQREREREKERESLKVKPAVVKVAHVPCNFSSLGSLFNFRVKFSRAAIALPFFPSFFLLLYSWHALLALQSDFHQLSALSLSLSLSLSFSMSYCSKWRSTCDLFFPSYASEVEKWLKSQVQVKYIKDTSKVKALNGEHNYSSLYSDSESLSPSGSLSLSLSLFFLHKSVWGINFLAPFLPFLLFYCELLMREILKDVCERDWSNQVRRCEDAEKCIIYTREVRRSHLIASWFMDFLPLPWYIKLRKSPAPVKRSFALGMWKGSERKREREREIVSSGWRQAKGKDTDASDSFSPSLSLSLSVWSNVCLTAFLQSKQTMVQMSTKSLQYSVSCIKLMSLNLQVYTSSCDTHFTFATLPCELYYKDPFLFHSFTLSLTYFLPNTPKYECRTHVLYFDFWIF